MSESESETKSDVIYDETVFQTEDRETEDNMIVIVEYQGTRYRVDFTKYNDEYQMMPRALKKIIVLEDIQKHKAQEAADREAIAQRVAELTKQNPSYMNTQKQNETKQGTVARLREKLRMKNPVKYKDIHDK